MKRIFLIVFSFLLFFTLVSPVFATSNPSTSSGQGVAAAQTPVIPSKDAFFQATVVSISQEKKTLEVRLSNSQKIVSVTYEPQSSGKIAVQDTVVVARTGIKSSQYYFVDEYRVSPLIFIVLGFFLFILLIAGWKGIGSIAGLCISLGVIFLYVVPQIIAGGDPLMVCTIGAVGILFVTTFVAHGVSRQTIIALIATLTALVGTYFLVQFISGIALITGFGNEDAVNLQFALPHMLNLKGLYLGGIILATLGALNDITITQAASIFSLQKTNPSAHFKELATEGYSIGREHALSLVNTLLLAFAGTSLAIFIFVLANPNGQPLWVILNSEFLVEEIIKIIAGTAGLLLAVPLVTLFAALACDKTVREYFKAYIK